MTDTLRERSLPEKLRYCAERLRAGLNEAEMIGLAMTLDMAAIDVESERALSLEEIATTYEAQLATHALGGDTPYGEGYNDGALDATKGFVKAIRSRLSALPESGGAGVERIEHAEGALWAIRAECLKRPLDGFELDRIFDLAAGNAIKGPSREQIAEAAHNAYFAHEWSRVHGIERDAWFQVADAVLGTIANVAAPSPESGGAATKPIASDDEHAVALARVEELMDARAGTPDGDELSALVDRVEAYEDKRWPIDAPSPDALALTDDEVCALVRERSLFVGWTCFHCGKSFSDEAAARKHFGADKTSEPACADALAQERAGEDMDNYRMDWLSQRTVNVSVPLVYGSRDLFWAAPDENGNRSDLRDKIDEAMKPAALRTRAKEKTDD